MRALSKSAPRPAPLWMVWFSPRGAFASLSQKPRAFMLVALLLAACVAPAITFVVKADVAAAMEKQMKRSGAWDDLPADNRDEIMQKIADAMVYLGPGGALLKRALYLFGIGLLALLLLRATNEDLRFSVVIAAVALGMTPVLLQDLLETLVFLVRDPTTLNLDSPLRSHLGAFAPDDWPKKLNALLAGVDLFALWVAGLVGVGLQVVSRSKSAIPYAIPLGAHVILVAIGVAFA